MKYRKIVFALFWILVWQILAMAVDNVILLATPVETLKAFLLLFGEPVFRQSVGASFLRIALGFLAGLFTALLLAAVSGRFPVAEELLKPVMTLLKTIPVASFVVLLLIWWGSSFLSAAICFLVVLPQIYIHTLEGVKSMDKRLLEMAQIFGVPFGNRFFYIYRPALRPFLYGSLQVSLGMCWKSGVAAEVIGISALSIGGQLYLSKISLDTPGVFAWTAVVILLSAGFEKLVLFGADCFFAWEPACKPARPGSGKKSGPAPGKEASALRCEDVCKSYGKQPVIRHFSAEYLPGKIYYLTSPSGSGKTTLLRLLCGLEKPEEGKISGGGDFSVMFQEDRLCEEYSPVRNVELVLGNRKRAEDALRELLEPEALHKPCSQLSGGMKRRVALVRAMEAEADCVLLDEPFTGMDEKTLRRAEEYIRRKQKGRIIVTASHI